MILIVFHQLVIIFIIILLLLLFLPSDNPMQTKALVSVPSTIVPSVPSFPRGRSLQAEEDYTSLPSFGGVRRIIYESMSESAFVIIIIILE